MNTSPELSSLIEALLKLKTTEEYRLFLEDLCTPAELAALTGRWRAACLVNEGLPYRLIHQKSGVSTATITRVARCVSSGAGGYRLALDRASKQIRNKQKEVRA